MDLARRVTRFLQAHRLAGTVGVVAVSGGPDSVALAHLLHGRVREGSLPRLILAHVNHQLRGAASDADEAFVTSLPTAWQDEALIVRVERFDTSRERGNLEETARRQRYEFLARLAAEMNAAWVATGHTADDQAETVLFRLLRGSGVQGLGGMKVRRPLAPGIELVRPLLDVRRAAVLDYLQSKQQAFREDDSNRDPRFTRNRLRHDLLPLLQRDYNPAVVDVLARLALQAQEVQADLAGRATQLLAEVELPRAGSIVVLRVEALDRCPALLAREAFRLVWQREGWPMGEMNYDDWQRLLAITAGDVKSWDFPGGIHARRVGRVLQLGERPA